MWKAIQVERGNEDRKEENRKGTIMRREKKDLVTFDSESKEEINFKITDFSLDNWENDDSIGILWIQKYVLCVSLREISPEDKNMKVFTCHVYISVIRDIDFVLLFSFDSM